MKKRDFKRCTICKEYHWTDNKCLPEYAVYHEEYSGDEPNYVRAVDHEDAAQEYAKKYNEDEYPMLNGDSEITVRVEFEGVTESYTVWAEPSIDYSSRQID